MKKKVNLPSGKELFYFRIRLLKIKKIKMTFKSMSRSNFETILNILKYYVILRFDNCWANHQAKMELST